MLSASSPPPRFPKPISPKSLVAITAGLLVLPVAADLAGSGPDGPFRYFSADAFYYFAIARNAILHGSLSFDQHFPTNGFHPLWQGLVCLGYAACHTAGLGEVTFLYWVLLLNLLLVAAATVYLGCAVGAAGLRLSMLFLLLPVGVYALIVSPAWLRYVLTGSLAAQNPYEGSQPLYGTLWSYVNGMESSLVLFFFAVCAHWHVRQRDDGQSLSSAVVCGLLLSCLCLSRLDHVFFPVSYLSLVFLEAWRRRNAALLRFALSASLVFGASMAAYMGANWLYVGAPLPVSGTLKTTFPRFNTQCLAGIRSLVAEFNRPFWLSFFWREAQLLIPVFFALFFLGSLAFRAAPWRRKGGNGPVLNRFDEYLGVTAVSVILLASYNFLFVPLSLQGHWYYPVSTLFCTLVPLSFAGRWKPSSHGGRGRSRWVSMAVLVGLQLAVFVLLHRRLDYHRRYSAFYLSESKNVVERYGARAVRLLCHDDGIVAFSLPFPTMSGTGLALDKEAARRYRDETILGLALDRGFDRVTTLVYQNFHEKLTKESSTEEIQRRIPFWPIQRNDLQLEVEYLSLSGEFAIYRVKMRE